jgi:hypothetical protein
LFIFYHLCLQLLVQGSTFSLDLLLFLEPNYLFLSLPLPFTQSTLASISHTLKPHKMIFPVFSFCYLSFYLSISRFLLHILIGVEQQDHSVPIFGYSLNFDLEFSYCRLLSISVVVVQLANSVKFKFLIAYFGHRECSIQIQFKP